MNRRQGGRDHAREDATDHQFFDTLTREISTGNTRRAVVGGLALGVFGWGSAQEVLSEGRGPVCSKRGCCKKGYKCCSNECCRK